MIADEEGFLYPSINDDVCINCNKCIYVCPLKNPVNFEKLIDPIVYAIKHKSEDIRINSTSGGVFTAISDKTLESNGVVYGVAYNKDMEVIHKAAYTKDARNELRGSKYVQSRLEDIYREIIDKLKDNKEVLFSGTPCQTAGLMSILNLLKVNSSKLILVDIVCHGTASPLVWHDYIKYLEKTRKKKIVMYSFRDKNQGWKGYNIRVVYEDGEIENNNSETLLYVNLYKSNRIIRPSCFKCRYANTKRPSDLTIGDFWGIENINKSFNDNKGVSLLYINTRKGSDVYKNIINNLITLESNVNDSLQLNLVQPTTEPFDRKNFWKDYRNRGFLYAARKFSKESLFRKMKMKIIRLYSHYCGLHR